jgi:hypothetical protein
MLNQRCVFMWNSLNDMMVKIILGRSNAGICSGNPELVFWGLT